MAFAAFVRSPARARDHPQHRHVPRPRACPASTVLTAATLGLEGGVPCASNPTGDAVQPRRPILAEGKVRMVGEPVAVVVAESQASRARRRRPRRRRLRAAAGRDRRRERGASPARRQLHDDAPGNHCCTIAPQDRGLRRGVRRRARQGLADGRQPAAHARLDRAPRGRGRLDHLERRADVLHLDAGAALRAHVRGGASAASPSRRCA